jgi:hypothetical protein
MLVGLQRVLAGSTVGKWFAVSRDTSANGGRDVDPLGDFETKATSRRERGLLRACKISKPALVLLDFGSVRP